MKLIIKTYYSAEKYDYKLIMYITLSPNNYNYSN